MVPIAGRDQLPCQLVVAVPGGRTQTQRILARERIGDGLQASRVEVLLPGFAGAQGGMERVQDGRLTCVEGFGALALFLKPDQYLIRIRVGDITDRLDDALAQPLPHQAGAKLVNRRRSGKPHIDHRAAFEINAVIGATLGDQRDHPQQKEGK